MQNLRRQCLTILGSVTVWLLIFLTIAFITVEFIFVLPRTPLMLAIDPYAGGIFRSYFFQSWNVFAPVPVDFSWTLRVNCNSDAPDEPWYDLTSHLTGEPSRTFSFGLHLAELELMLATKRAGRSSNPDPKQRAASEETLRRLGSLACADLSRPAGPRMRMRLDVLRAPPWLERRSPSIAESWDLGELEIIPMPRGSTSPFLRGSGVSRPELPNPSSKEAT